MSDTTIGYTHRDERAIDPGEGMIRVPIVDGYRAGLEAVVPERNVPATLEYTSTAFEGKFTYALARTALPIERYDHNLAYVQVSKETEWSPWKSETD